MKTQISRDSFQPDKRYSGIQQQQGRMITDADWNELGSIARDQIVQALIDVIGNGSPRTGAITVQAAKIAAGYDKLIVPGDLYVDGVHATLPGQTPLKSSAQPDLPGYPDLPASGSYTIYADVWDRSLTSLEDPELLDPALHGADTCTRMQTMLQVKTCPPTVNPEKDLPQRGNGLLSLDLNAGFEAGDPCDPCAGLISLGKGRVGNYLFRVEVHDVEGPADNPTRLKLKWSSENGAEQYAALKAEKMPPGFVDSGFGYEFHDLTSEKHLGLQVGSGFTPTRGVLSPVYAIPATPGAPKEFVRRWDGYCELARSGSAWTLAGGVDRGVELSTSSVATAPGHVALAGSLQINLEALRLTLVLTGKTFVAGDFWLAAVRESIHKAGSAVASSAEPKGVLHHYLCLARVQADGSLLPPSDQELRRHSFPPLSDLHAHDVGYRTTCGSGLFDASHDNVEKALNRLCSLAAEHIAYSASCSKGIYAGFAGTVKQALDKLCELQARQVGFAKPCDTSIYKGATVATVEDALKLLCNVQAGQISYRPGPSCELLSQPGIDTVQAALDALCARPMTSGCRLTIGPGGVFATLEEALKSLLEKKVRDIALCFLPGDHDCTGELYAATVAGQSIYLSGSGPATRLQILKESVVFKGFASLTIADLTIVTKDSPAGALFFDQCRQLSMREMSISGPVADEKFLVGVRAARDVTLHDLVLDASSPASLAAAADSFAFNETLSGLFATRDEAAFEEQALAVAATLAGQKVADRKKLLPLIEAVAQDNTIRLTAKESASYLALVSTLKNSPTAEAILDKLKDIRKISALAKIGTALAVCDAKAEWSIDGCTILGILSLYGPIPAGQLSAALLKALEPLIKEPKIGFSGDGKTFRVSGSTIYRVDFDRTVLQRLNELVGAQKGTLAGLFDQGTFTAASLLAGDNQLVFVGSQLSSALFSATDGILAVVLGTSAILVGNQGASGTIIRNLTRSSTAAANLGLSIV